MIRKPLLRFARCRIVKRAHEVAWTARAKDDGRNEQQKQRRVSRVDFYAREAELAEFGQGATRRG